MKNLKGILLPVALLISLFSAPAIAQISIVSSSTAASPISCGATVICTDVLSVTYSGPDIYKHWGDGSVSHFHALAGGTDTSMHTYAISGTYTIKTYVNGVSGSPDDSTTQTYSYVSCNDLAVHAYFDMNGNCTEDAGEDFVHRPARVAVDSAGIPVDTIDLPSCYRYAASGPSGTVYTFTLVSPPPASMLSCPSSGVVSVTIPPAGTPAPDVYFGFVSDGTFDVGVTALDLSSTNRSAFCIFAENAAPAATASVVTLTYSPKYKLNYCSPTPSSVTANTITWSFPALSAASPEYCSVILDPSGAPLTLGDTVYSSVTITPVSGDTDPSNNSVNIFDTVKGSYDPNFKSVMPKGDIAPGTKLTYTIGFENTGTDTAFNIHIQDTLSANLDASSLRVISSSAQVTLYPYTAGGSNIVKFDFPGINLLDSSHHGLCDGYVTFSVDARSALSPDTYINNRAGIYFDANDVVMTNTVYNHIPVPASVAAASPAPVRVYPNPVHDVLYIDASAGTYQTITVVNALYQPVVKQLSQSGQVNVHALPPGIYYLLLTGSNSSAVQKFEKL